MIGRSLYTATLRLSSLNWKDSIKTLFRKEPMAKKFRFNKDTPKVVISQDKQPPKKQPDPQALYCIEENVTTGWEVLETNLTRENCKQKFAFYSDNFGLPPDRIRVRRIQ